MPKSDKPKVPPTEHRSSGDTGVPQRGKEVQDVDDAGQAVESGEPGEAGRSRGRVIDKGGGTGEREQRTHDPADDEHWESGRHNSD